MICIMPSSERPRVFLSYAHKDGSKLARRLQEDLTTQFDVWLDIQRLIGGDVWSREIEGAIDRADVVLALLSTGSYTSDICRIEQTRGLEKGKCVVPVLVHSDCEVPDYLRTRQCLDFSNNNLYPALLPKLVVSIQKQAGIAVTSELLVRYNNTPALPENLVDRPELLEALRNTLFAEAANRNIALTALQGMGGSGKTVLAQALCRDEVVQQAFPDGIFWFALGKESQLDFQSRLKSVPGLDRLVGPYDGEAACLAQYREVLRKKAVLIVLDDVWRGSDVQVFIADSPRSRLLITTRDTSIGAWFGAREFTANLLTDAESRQVLSKWCRRAVADLPPQANDVIQECGYLPLALAMIAAQLRGKPRALWNLVVDHLRNADLEKIKAQFPEPHTTLFRAIQISVDALEETARQRYLALAVLLEGMAAPPQVQQCVWGLDETEAAETAAQFVDLSLALREQPEDSIRLHDLQLDYVRAQHPDRQALDLIHGAVRLSSHVIEGDPSQFASQIVGRLLPYVRPEGAIPAVQQFTSSVVKAAPRPWLRPSYAALSPPGTALVRTLAGHSNWVEGVAISADGRRAVSASWDRTLKVWDLESGRELRTLKGQSAAPRGVAASADWRRAVSVSEDGMLRVWDLENGRDLRTLSAHSGGARGVAVSADGQLAVSAAWDRTLKVWGVESGKELLTLRGHSAAVCAVAVTADRRRAVSASADQTLKVWDLETGRELYTFEGHSAEVSGVAVSANGRRVVSASADKTLKVWDLESGRELHTLEGHSDGVKGVAVSADGRRAVSASQDKTLKVWDLDSGELRTILLGHSGWVNAVALTPNGWRAVSASQDGMLKVWDLDSARKLDIPAEHSGSVNGVSVSADGRRAVSASADKTLKVWDLEGGRELRTLEGHSWPVLGAAVSANGRRAVSASADQTLKVWDLESGRELRTLEGHSDGVKGVAVSADGRRAISGSWDGTLKVWDAESGKELRTLRGHSADVYGVSVSADGRRAVSASADQTLKVWDLEDGRELHTLAGHSDSVNGVSVSADGRRAVSASADTTLKMWDADSGKELLTLCGHSAEVPGPGVRADLAALLGMPRRAGAEVSGVAVSADGRRAVSVSVARTLKVWNLETGALVSTFTFDAPVRCCALSGARRIVVGDEVGRVHFLSLELKDED